MRTICERGLLYTGVRLLLGIVLLSAGILKLQDLEAFADSISAFQVCPTFIIDCVAIGLPPTEIILGVMLICGCYERSALFATVFLLLLFSGIMAQALLRGLNVNCGCFGVEQPSRWIMWGTLSRDILLLCMATISFIRISGARLKGF